MLSPHKIYIVPFDPGPLQIGDRDWARLETAGKISLSPTQRTNIGRAIKKYKVWSDAYRNGVRLSEVKPLFKEIASNANRLLATLQKLPKDRIGEAARFRLSQQAAKDREIDRAADFSDDMMSDLRRLIKYARAEIALPDVGRNNNPFVSELIIDIHSIYSDAGGVGLISDNSVAFIERCFAIAGIPTKKLDTLRRDIRRAVGKTPAICR